MKKRINKLAIKIQQWSTKTKHPKFIQIISNGDNLIGLTKKGEIYQYRYDEWCKFDSYYSNHLNEKTEHHISRIADALEKLAPQEKKK